MKTLLGRKNLKVGNFGLIESYLEHIKYKCKSSYSKYFGSTITIGSFTVRITANSQKATDNT